MGFFSWRTADTQESIANDYVSHPNTGKKVYLLQPNNMQPIESTGYEGYGVFGGVDAYAWLAKMNGHLFDVDVANQIADLDLYDDVESLRTLGINLAFNEDIELDIPIKLSFNKDARYERLAASEMCEYQGFFYPSDDE